MKTHKILYAVLSLLLITNIGFGQGINVKPGTNVIIDGGTTLKVADGDNLHLEDDLTYSPSLLERGNLSFTGGGELGSRTISCKGAIPHSFSTSLR